MVYGGVASHEVSNSTEEVGFHQKLRVKEEVLARISHQKIEKGCHFMA